MTHINIGKREIGPGCKSFLIAEVAQAHDGSLGAAHAFIDAAAAAGADAIKFQTHIADAESTFDEPFRVRMSGQDATRYDYWKRMEFSASEWSGLAKHAKQKKLVFLSSAFSVQAVQLLEKIGMPAWKIGSGEFRSEDLLRAMIKTRKPLLLSTGMSRYKEISTAVSLFKKNRAKYALFQCTSSYPTPLEDAGLNVLQEYRKRYKCPVGLSDHSGTPWPSLAAMAQGADMIEVHVHFDRLSYGPDAPASVTFQEFALLASARDHFHTLMSNPVDKDKMAEKLRATRKIFTKSIAFAQPQAKGTRLTEKMLVPKKPGSGIDYAQRHRIIGKKLVRDVPHTRLLKWEDLESGS